MIYGTRAMESPRPWFAVSAGIGLIDLHYEAISEEASFKSIMTSTGCMLLLESFLSFPLPPLARPWVSTGRFISAYLIPPMLVVFAVLQLLQYGIPSEARPKAEEASSADQ